MFVSSWLKRPFRFLSSSISRKIILPYALLTLVLAILGVFIVVRLVSVSFENRLKTQLREAAQVVADEVVNRERMRLEIERLVANTIGVGNAVVDRDIEALDELISPVIANARLIDSIIVVDTQGKELVRFQRQGVGANMFIETIPASGADLSEWQSVREVLADREGNKSVQLVLDPTLDELIIYTVGSVQRGGAPLGAVLVGTYLDNELGMLQNTALAQLTLFDDTGAVLGTTFALDREDAATVFGFFTAERYQEVIDRQELTLLEQMSFPELEADGLNDTALVGEQDYRLAYAPFRLRDGVFGVYAVALPTNFITTTTNQSRNTMTLLFVVGVITVIGVGLMVSRRITVPIMQLVRTSLAISAGDLDQRTGMQREDEIGILASTFDQMTAELQRLLKIREEEASRLSAILTSIADGVIVENLEGDIAIVNPAAEDIIRMIEANSTRSPSMISQLAADAAEPMTVKGDSGAAVIESYLGNIDLGERHRFSVGQRMLSAISAPVVSSGGERVGTVVVLRDVTREHESEKLKDNFITSISHELRTPLTAIKGYNELLKLTASNKLDEQQLQFVATIDSNVEDLLEIIQQMLDLSQIDAGELGIDQEPLNFTELVVHQAQFWSGRMEEHELYFSTNIPSEPVWVIGDHARLTRVLHNLIKNAWQYTLPGGRVVVNVRPNGEYVQTDVVDTGVGIALQDQKYIFTRFFRAIHEEHTFELSGAGLGLYTSRAIVEAHNGKLWMRSELNKGSTFTFSLPCAEPDTDFFDHED
jgi:signal transduction histidine kinase